MLGVDGLVLLLTGRVPYGQFDCFVLKFDFFLVEVHPYGRGLLLRQGLVAVPAYQVSLPHREIPNYYYFIHALHFNFNLN